MHAGGIDQRRAESEPGGRIVIAADHDDPRARITQPDERVLAKQDGIQRRHRPVVDIAADEHRVDPLRTHHPDQGIEELGLGFPQVSAVQRAAEMPVGGVKDAHKRTVGRATDKTRAKPGAPDCEHAGGHPAGAVRPASRWTDPSSARSDRGCWCWWASRSTTTVEQANALAGKIYTLRILEGERSAQDLAAPLLVISQFTLYADTRKGRRPSWNAAAPGPVAEPLVDAVVERLRELGATRGDRRLRCADGRSAWSTTGPFTLIVDV